MSNPTSADTGGWSATLHVQLTRRNGGPTVLAENRHNGPLRVQKLLHPAPGAPAELLLVHPPGGIAGGDSLRLDMALDAGAQCLVTTPGATRWYRSGGRPARQECRLQVGPGSTLEWLPQDSIVQEEADGLQSTRIELTGDASMIGWDLVQLGQPQAGRPWSAGRWRQQFELVRDGRLLLAERLDLRAAELAQADPLRLAGYPVMGMLWASGPALQTLSEAALARCRTLAGADPTVPCAVSWLAAPVACLVARALAHDAQALRQRLLALWMELRPLVISSSAVVPRIWAT